MTLTMADSIRYICDLFAKQTPTLLSWPICTSMDLMLIITPLETNARTLITTKYRRLGGNGLERNRRQDYNFYARTPAWSKIQHFAQNTPIYSRNKQNPIVDMEDIRYTIRKGRYSDKQTTKRSRPFTTLV